jgi:hypothetical protein
MAAITSLQGKAIFSAVADNMQKKMKTLTLK